MDEPKDKKKSRNLQKMQWSIVARPADQVNYILDAHQYGESSQMCTNLLAIGLSLILYIYGITKYPLNNNVTVDVENYI